MELGVAPPLKVPPPREEVRQRGEKGERKKQFVKRLEGEKKNLLIEKKRNKSC